MILETIHTKVKGLKRSFKFLIQRMTRGWDDSETWSLDYSLGKLILPRLKRFRELNIAYPPDMTKEQWDSIIDQMIWSFEFISSDKRWDCYDKEEWDKFYRGMTPFTEYYANLWW